jgi:hypothetical protein
MADPNIAAIEANAIMDALTTRLPRRGKAQPTEATPLMPTGRLLQPMPYCKKFMASGTGEADASGKKKYNLHGNVGVAKSRLCGRTSGLRFLG